MEYTYKRFIANNPEAKLLAKKKIHPKMDESAYMYIYYYSYHDRHGYMFRFREMMVLNPVTLQTKIPEDILPIFCYEWFMEWIRISGINEMFEEGDEFYHSPSHMNFWEFEEKWNLRYGQSFGFKEGEGVREYRKEKLFSHLESLSENATKEEKEEIKKRLGELIRAL